MPMGRGPRRRKREMPMGRGEGADVNACLGLARLLLSSALLHLR